MTDRERGFLDAVLADPRDDFPRLVYADWLEEEGRVERAEFIRVQCELARTPEPEPCETEDGAGQCNDPDCAYRLRQALRVREWQLLTHANRDDWCSGLPSGWGFFAPEFRRGFVASVSLTLADFLTHAGAIFGAAPVEEVRLLDREPFRSGRYPGQAGWYGQDAGSYPDADYLPPELWGSVVAGVWRDDTGMWFKWFSSVGAAHAALSRACVRYGRDSAGLTAKETVSP